MTAARRALLGIGVTVVFLGVVFWRVDLGEVWATLRGANYLLLVPAVAVYFAAFWLRAWRWQLLLAHLGPVTVGRSYWVATIGYAANNLLPLRMGEFLRVFLLRKRPGISATSSLATIAVERVLDGLTLLIWLGVILFAMASTWSISPSMTLVFQGTAFLFGIAGLGFVLALLAPGRTLRVLGFFLRPLPNSWASLLMSLAQSFLTGLEGLRRGRMLPAYVLLSNGIWAGEAVLYFLVAEALGIQVSTVVLLAAVAASNLATSIPSSSGAVGPFELLAKETLVLSGIGASVATAYALLVHATLLVPVSIVGVLFLVAEGVSVREAVRMPRLTSTEVSE